MFSKLFSGKRFDTMYQGLVPFVKDKDVQDKLINNKDMLAKYNKNKTLIDTFLIEVSKYHKYYEICEMVNKYIINLEEKDLIHLLMLYLNLSDDKKQDKEFFDYYDQEHNLVDKTEEEYMNEHKIDEMYNNLKKGNESFNGIQLDVLYKDLPYELRSYINSLLYNKEGWNTFNILFEERYKANFKSLLELLNSSLIDGEIINDDLYSNLGDDKFRELVYSLLLNNNLEIAKHIKTLVSKRRYDLIEDMIDNKLIGDVVFINAISQEELTVDKLIEHLESIRVKRQVNN